MDTIVSEDKPNLEQKSEWLATVKGAGFGAVIGAAVTLGAFVVPSVYKKMNFKSYGEAVTKVLPWITGTSAVAGAAVADIQAGFENEDREKAKAYVEKLEADRNRLANIALNGGVQKA